MLFASSRFTPSKGQYITTNTMKVLTARQIKHLEGMITRRMLTTGEARDEACQHIANYLRSTTNTK